MKLKITIIIWSLLLGIGFAGELPRAPTADEIVKKANHMALYQGMDFKGSITMEIKDKQGRIRKRAFNILRKNADVMDRDQQYYTFFQEPADVRKMVFMVHKHAALETDDDRWLYLPSLDLVKRIAASDKRTSFVGSDFLYEDISGRSPDEDRHKLINTTTQYYWLKSIPRIPGNVEFEYYISHIDKGTFMPMKIEFFKKGDRCYRVIETMKLKRIPTLENGNKVTYPTVVISMARNLENGSESRMNFSHVQYNIGLSHKIFTERYLRRPPRDAMR